MKMYSILEVKLHVLAVYHHGKSPWCPLDRRLGGPQSHGGRYKLRNLRAWFDQTTEAVFEGKQ
jgi:hypothetical protein